MSVQDAIRRSTGLGGNLGQVALGLHSAGVLTPPLPGELWRMMRGVIRSGRSPAALLALWAARCPERTAIVDERDCMSFGELHARVEAVAGALAEEHALGPGQSVALMCRNHCGLVVGMFAAMRTGCDVAFLNTEFPAPQLQQVLARQDFALAIHDEEYEAVFDAAGFRRPRITAWQDRPGGWNTLDDLASLGAAPPRRVEQPGKLVILTSGTTGLPKGAARGGRTSDLAGALATILRRTPFRTDAPVLIAPPLFHGFGLAVAALALGLGSPILIRRHFDVSAVLADIARFDAKVLFAVPVMLQRLLDAPDATRYDLSGLDAVLAGAAPLSPSLALRWMDAHGDKLYNLYGSTEVGFAALATPEDLRAAPGCVGRAPIGVVTRVMDASGEEKAVGETGHICVGSPMLIEGYIGGGSKPRLGGLMNTGDLGHYDTGGRLHVDGREDDMIVSGGENVYPQEVEDVLARLHGVRDVAVIGVPDAQFGQRLKAFVVRGEGGVDEDALRSHVKANLARYKMPREFVFMDELPRNPSGKVLRRVLAATP